VDVRSVRPPRNRIWRMSGTLLMLFWNGLRLNSDLYVLHDVEMLIVGLLLRLCGRHVLYDVHEFHADAMMEKPYLWQPLRPLVRIGITAFETCAARRVSGVMTATDTLREQFEKRGIAAITVRNCPISVSEASVQSRRRQADFNIIFAGSIYPA